MSDRKHLGGGERVSGNNDGVHRARGYRGESLQLAACSLQAEECTRSEVTSTDSRYGSAICHLSAACCELPSNHAHHKGPSLPRLRRPRIRTRVVLRSFRRPGRPACQSVVESSHLGVECRRLGRHPGTDPQQHSCENWIEGSQWCPDRDLRRDSVAVAQSFHRPSSTCVPPRRGAGTD